MDDVSKNVHESIPNIGYHTTWISVDPILGCPASCSYCYLHSNNLTKMRPNQILSPKKMYQILSKYQYLNNHIFEAIPKPNLTPIAIGNHTDMCATPSNRDYLIRFLKIHKANDPARPVCILTKAILDHQFLHQLDELQLKIIIFVSLAFLPPEFEKGTPSILARLDNFKKIKLYQNLQVLHWWRPITRLVCTSYQQTYKIMLDLRNAGVDSFIAIGLMYGDALYSHLVSKNNPLSPIFEKNQSVSIQNAPPLFPSEIQLWLQEAAKELELHCFFSTSCALSFLLETRCLNSRFRALHSKTNCYNCEGIAKQHARCRTYSSVCNMPSEKLLKEIAKYLGISNSQIRYNSKLEDIELDCEISQEIQNFLTHATSFSIVAATVHSRFAWSEAWRTIRY